MFLLLRLEAPRREASNEYTQHIFVCAEIKKTTTNNKTKKKKKKKHGMVLVKMAYVEIRLT